MKRTESGILWQRELELDLLQEPLLCFIRVLSPLDVFPYRMIDFTVQSILDGRPAGAPVVYEAEDIGEAELEKGVDHYDYQLGSMRADSWARCFLLESLSPVAHAAVTAEGITLTLISNGISKQLPLQPLRLDRMLLCPARPRAQTGLFGRLGDGGRVAREAVQVGLDVGHDKGAKGDVDVAGA